MAALDHDIATAIALGSEVLVFQTPADLMLERDEAKGLRDLASSIPPRIRVALEPRAHRSEVLPSPLANTLRDIGGIDVIDLSRGETPRVSSDVLYTRLFGASNGNVWEFSDAELRAIGDAADRQDVDRVIFTFHGVKMYKDAARFHAFRATGEFPRATRAAGPEAVREVLAPDARWPMARNDLLRDHGWKVVTLPDGRNVHTTDLFRELPDTRYSSADQVVRSLGKGTSKRNMTEQSKL